MTEPDHQGAVTWVDCPLCGAVRDKECASVFILGDEVFVVTPEPGKVHELRFQKWLEFKARVVAGTKSFRCPNLQQVPRLNNAQRRIRQEYKELMFGFNYGYPRNDAMRWWAWLLTWDAIGKLYAAEID